jgi:hypothetical protein
LLSTSEWIKDLGPTIVSALVFAAALYQYIKAQRWKASEFAASQLAMLWNDERIRFACLALDWRVRTVRVSEAYGAIAPAPTFVHEVEVMQEALATEAKRMVFPWPRTYYQDCFDRFFEYLTLLNHYVEIGLFEASDIIPIRYWTRLLIEPKFATNAAVFTDYCQYYGYHGVEQLATKLEAVN